MTTGKTLRRFLMVLFLRNFSMGPVFIPPLKTYLPPPLI